MRGYFAYVIFTALAGVGLYSLLCVGMSKYVAFGISTAFALFMIMAAVKYMTSKLVE